MSQSDPPALRRIVAAGQVVGRRGVCRVWNRLFHRRLAVAIMVVIANSRRRRHLQCRLHGGVRQLQRTFGPQPLTVVVQERLDGGQRAGCHMVHRRPDGTPATLIRLALTVGEHRLTVDELLAALVDEYVTLHDPTPNAAGLEALFTDLGAARNGVRVPPAC